MKQAISFIAILTFSILFTTQALAQDKIKWYDFEEAVELNKKKPKKFFVDMYTDWCGWCKRMDQTTFIDPVIVQYMNDNYYPVKFNAERKDTVLFRDREYINPNPEGRRSSHQLAIALLQGKMSYPSFVFMNENAEVITIVPGYRKAPEFEPILHFIGEDAFKKESWEQFMSGFEGSFQQND